MGLGGVQVVSAAQRAGHAWSLRERKLRDNPLLQANAGQPTNTPSAPGGNRTRTSRACNTPQSGRMDKENATRLHQQAGA